MISAVLFLNSRGDVLISRSYRDDIVIRSIAEAFRTQIVAPNLADRSPVKTLGSVSFLHIKHENMFIVGVTRANINAAMVFQFLYRIVDVLRAYFGGSLTEDTLRENFVLVYELLDEILDFGYPQNSDTDILKLYIATGGLKMDIKSKEKAKQITIQATGAINWRREGIKYRKNEVFLDVVESVNMLISNKGDVLSSDVSGQVLMKCFLSGMPECKFGLNDKLVLEKEKPRPGAAPRRAGGIEIDDVTFHQCVKLGKFDADRTISFVPPDGEFELMKYRITDNIIHPFKVLPPIIRELGRTRLEVQVTVKAMFNARLFGQNVVVKIPCPKNTAECKISVAAGKAKYDAEEGGIVWKIRRFPGDAEYSLSAEVNLIASTLDKKGWSRPPISLDFQVPMFTASGLHVRFLKVFEKSNYQAIKWVRYITKSESKNGQGVSIRM